MAACTYMRKWQDFDMVAVVTTPMFLFSGTFFPITVYPDWLRFIVELTPLYRGVHLLRSFTTGIIDPMVLVDIAYLSVMSLIGVAITARRLRILLLK
jgi:lipooligosaccharide transport system permease protein